MGGFTDFGPAVGAVEGGGEAFGGAVGGGAVVEGHDDVGAKEVLDAHGFLWGKADDGAINVTAEGYSTAAAGVVEGAEVGEGEDLKAAGVGEHGAIPAAELLEAAECGNGFGAGAEEEVVGIAEDDLTAGGAGLSGGDALNGAAGADAHEGGGIEGAVGGGDASEACGGGGVLVADGKGEAHGKRLTELCGGNKAGRWAFDVAENTAVGRIEFN